MIREPFIAHSELTNEIYIVSGREKYRVTEQAIKAVDAIKALKQEPQTRWISVSDRLPEKGGDYLVTIKWKGSYSGDVYTETNMAVYKEKEKEWDCAGIVAWMPLPEPYAPNN